MRIEEDRGLKMEDGKIRDQQSGKRPIVTVHRMPNDQNLSHTLRKSNNNLTHRRNLRSDEVSFASRGDASADTTWPHGLRGTADRMNRIYRMRHFSASVCRCPVHPVNPVPVSKPASASAASPAVKKIHSPCGKMKGKYVQTAVCPQKRRICARRILAVNKHRIICQ